MGLFERLTERKLNKIILHEIVQTDNYNSYSKLFIYEGEVYKIYIDEFKKVKYNIANLKRIILYHNYLNKIPELVLPKKLLVYRNHIVGFTMPFIEGNTLQEAIVNNILTEEEMIEVFIKINEVIDKILKLPFSFYLSDLHEKNVIIDKEKNIHIIDCDGFIFSNNKMVVDNEIVMGKYLNRIKDNNKLKKVKTNGDYYCLFCMVMYYILGNDVNMLEYKKYGLMENSIIHNIIDRIDDFDSFKLSSEEIVKIIYEKEKYKMNCDKKQKIYEEIALLVKRIRFK